MPNLVKEFTRKPLEGHFYPPPPPPTHTHTLGLLRVNLLQRNPKFCSELFSKKK